MANSPPTISVITPSYNQGRFIERTIRSVLEQQYPALEYWVFDGGSTDETVAILRRYGDQLRWSSENDRGQADAVNKGIRASSGEIIGWLNSDDIYCPGALAAVAARFQAEPDVDLIYGAANHIDATDRVIGRYPTEPWSLDRFYETCFLCQPAVFFRRSVVRRWGYLDENLHFCMDYEYWLRLAHAGARFSFYDSKILAGSRLHSDAKTLAKRSQCHAEINDMLFSKLGKTPSAWIIAYANAVADSTFGIPRAQRIRHSSIVTLTALYSSLRWNKQINFEVLKYLRRLIARLVR